MKVTFARPVGLVLHQKVPPDAPESDRDVFAQREVLMQVLHRLNYQPVVATCTLNLQQLEETLEQFAPRVVINLVESLGGTDQLMGLIPLLLEARGIPFTGSSALAIAKTGDKRIAKQELHAAGLPTPAWQSAQESTFTPVDFPCRVIVKAVREHASVGMTDESVFLATDSAHIAIRIAEQQQKTGQVQFVEKYIPGREFNLSLLARADGVEVLPAAEIQFLNYPEGKPQIVGYQAKWDESSLEYQQTPRRFEFPPEESGLIQTLNSLAEQCWHLFDLAGYARVDFRVDATGQPWILEINANPCLSPDAGFAAALEQAGVDYDHAIQRILESALKTSENSTFVD